MLRPHLIDDKKALGRFQEEAKSAKNMTHVNLAAVYDYGVGKHGAPYLVMDYLEGKSLEKIIKEEHGLAVPRAIDLFIQITEAIGHAHAKGLIHRDVKPSNIIVENVSDGVELVKLVDFGIAKSLLGANSMQRTRTGDVIGSPPYMAPEQCEGTKLDVRADIYSLGCVMYETLCGHAPFTGKNAIQIILKHIKEAPVTVSQACTEQKIPDDLNYIVMRCLQKERWQRYQNIGELRADLERFKSHKAIKHFIPTVPGPEPKALELPGELNQTTPKRPRSAWTNVANVLAAVLVMLSLGSIVRSLLFGPTQTEMTHTEVNAPVSERVPGVLPNDEMHDYDYAQFLTAQPGLDATRVSNLANRFEALNQPKRAIPLYQFTSHTYASAGRYEYVSSEKHLGDCYRKLGDNVNALKCYKAALISFDNSSLKKNGDYAAVRAKIVESIRLCAQK
jgi:serine/threonine protein kinase